MRRRQLHFVPPFLMVHIKTSSLLIVILGVLLARYIVIATAFVPSVELSSNYDRRPHRVATVGRSGGGGNSFIPAGSSFPRSYHLACHRNHGSTTTRLNAFFDDNSSFASNYPIPLWAVVALALSIGIGANVWIQQLLSGDRGLGNFLSDGSGFGRSKFQPLTTKDQDRAVSSDPLPWLRLPKFDFVEVAGRDNDDSAGGSASTSADDATFSSGDGDGDGSSSD
jgi:hypothetical protein